MSADVSPVPGLGGTAITRRVARAVAIALGIAASAALTGWLVGSAVSAVAGDRNAPWIVGRSAGIGSYLLLVALVGLGLALSHPWRTRVARPSTAARIRAHVTLAVFTACLTALHIVVLATDHYAGVGWAGALLPMGAEYRPAAVTLGVIGLYAGLAAGLTAALAGRFGGRLWWPIHKVAIVSFLLVWAHGVLAGGDTAALLWLYLVTGGALMLLAISRYAARTPRDRRAALLAEERA